MLRLILWRRALVGNVAGLALALTGTLAFSQQTATIDPEALSVKSVQSLISQLKSASNDIQEINVHVKTPAGLATVASTNSDTIGKAPPLKDAEVIEDKTLSIRNNDGVFDIKVPLKTASGESYGSAAIMLGQAGLTIPKAKEKAFDIAKKIEQAFADVK